MEGPAPSEVKRLSMVSGDPGLAPDQFDDEGTPKVEGGSIGGDVGAQGARRQTLGHFRRPRH